MFANPIEQQQSLERIYGASFAEYQLDLRQQVKLATTPAQKVDAIDTYLYSLSSEHVGREMLSLLRDETATVVWPVFHRHWIMCDASYHWQLPLALLLERAGECPQEFRDEYFSNLPEKIELFRGNDGARIKRGISWTTDRTIAAQYASGMRYSNIQNPVIATATIAKSDILFATNMRLESEVVCLPDILKIEGLRRLAA